MTAEPFGARLHRALDDHGPLCVGIDPHRALIAAWGLSLDVEGLARFADACVEAFAGTVALVKPQSAFFEAFGSAGVAVLERTTSALREAGNLVCLDVKRGDIGSTMEAYAEAYLDPGSPGAADAMTVSPYLGVGALQPAFDVCERAGTGVFVLARTSNPEGAGVQQAVTADGSTVAAAVVADLATRNAGAAPMGSLGVVVGATVPEAPDLSALNGPVLVPGIGAQGGTAADVARLVGDRGRLVVPSVSREVLRAGPDPAALRSAAWAAADRFAFLR